MRKVRELYAAVDAGRMTEKQMMAEWMRLTPKPPIPSSPLGTGTDD
jgi:hypothetical protein